MSVDREYRLRVSLVTEGAPEARRGMQNLTEATEESGKAAEHAGISHRALHKILHLIAHEAGPEAGAALAGVAVAGGAGLGIAILAVKELLEGIHKLREGSEEAQKTISEIGMAMRDSAEESQEVINEYVAKLNETKDPAEKIEASFKRQKAELQDLLEAHNKILEAMEKQELAAAQGDKSKEEEIRSRYEQLKAAAGQAGELSQLRAHEQYIGQLQARQPGLESAASAASADLSYLKSIRPVPVGFKIDEEQENKLRTAARESAEFLERVQTGKTTTLENIKGFDPHTAAQQAADAQKALEDYQKNRQALLDYQNAIKTEEKIVDDNTAAREKNKDTIQKETDALEIERGKHSGNVAGDVMGRAIELSKRAAAGENLNSSESQFVQSLGTMVAGQNVSLQTAESMFNLAAQKASVMDSYLTRIMALLEKMPDPAAFEARMRALENKFATLQSSTPRISPTGQ